MADLTTDGFIFRERITGTQQMLVIISMTGLTLYVS
jgi:hypothetical protein